MTQASDIEEQIKARMLAYEQVLQGTKGLFLAAEVIGREAFARYFNALHIDRHYPGMLGLGLAIAIPEQQLQTHIDAIKSEGFPRYNVTPLGKRSLYSSIVFLEPSVGANLSAIGFDMYSEAVRRTAMERSVSTGEAALSSRVTLVQDVDREGAAGTLLYLAILNNEIHPDSNEDGIFGWVYSPFSMDVLMQGLNLEKLENLDLAIYDGTSMDREHLLYANESLKKQEHDAQYNSIRQLNIAGQAWTLAISSTAYFEKNTGAVTPYIFVPASVLISLLLSTLIWSLVTSRERAERQAAKITEDLRSTEYRWATALASAGDAVWDWNCQQDYFVYYDNKKTMMRYLPNKIGASLAEWKKIIHPNDQHALMSAMESLLTGSEEQVRQEFRSLQRDGSWNWLLMRGAAVEKDDSGATLRAIGTLVDINERKNADEKNKFHAMHDELTGLPNRRLVNDRIENIQNQAKRYLRSMAIMFIDIDRFKVINDTHGHDVGDMVLCAVADRLRRSVRLSDTVGRFGGDEFVAILPEIKGQDDILHVVKKIQEVFYTPLKLRDIDIQITLSIGIVLYDPASNDSVENLLKKADTALYDVKKAGRNGFKIFGS